MGLFHPFQPQGGPIGSLTATACWVQVHTRLGTPALFLKGSLNMKLTTSLAVSVFLLFTALSASSQEIPSPNISGTSVQGTEVDLNEFKGEKNVLVVFYRMHT